MQLASDKIPAKYSGVAKLNQDTQWLLDKTPPIMGPNTNPIETANKI
ncbi:MAG: hypothetical protein ACD_29C00425G0001 [uncultured bacterium]|nr:MAG: hypothetical protein ACD_29C00425G0001 [uncultured bacterium]